MTPLIQMLWAWRRAIGWGLVVAAVAFAGWRVQTWHESHKALKVVQAELAAERACEPMTACQERAAALAEQARAEAAIAAQAALGKAQEAEAKARADASAWRAKYRAAIQTDPGCREWSEQPIRCPVE